MPFDSETANKLRSQATLDGLFGQAANLIDQAAGLANEAERLADELCGQTPEAVGGDPDAPRSGRIDQLSQMLDAIAHHQHRARAANRRLTRSLLSQPDGAEVDAGPASMGGSLTTKLGRY